MRAKTPIEQRIQVRAYYLWLKHHNQHSHRSMGAGDYWYIAECHELALAAKRSEAAKKGAATKRANACWCPGWERLVAGATTLVTH